MMLHRMSVDNNRQILCSALFAYSVYYTVGPDAWKSKPLASYCTGHTRTSRWRIRLLPRKLKSTGAHSS